jgi:hypothetical protein
MMPRGRLLTSASSVHTSFGAVAAANRRGNGTG